MYSIWFFSHQICAVLLFGAFLLLFYRVRGGPGTVVWSRAAPRSSVPPSTATEGGGTLASPVPPYGNDPTVRETGDGGTPWWRSTYMFAALAGLLAGYSLSLIHI